MALHCMYYAVISLVTIAWSSLDSSPKIGVDRLMLCNSYVLIDFKLESGRLVDGFGLHALCSNSFSSHSLE